MKSYIKIIDRRGRITIPQEIRIHVGINDGDIIKITIQDQSVVLKKVGVLDQEGNTPEELLMNIHNALSYLDEKKRIEIAKSILKTIERKD